MEVQALVTYIRDLRAVKIELVLTTRAEILPCFCS